MRLSILCSVDVNTIPWIHQHIDRLLNGSFSKQSTLTSLAQYRAAIGTWAAGRLTRTLPPPPCMIPSPEGTPPEQQIQTWQFQGLWKIHAMLLTTLLTIMILLSCTSTLPTSTATAHSTVSAIYDAKDGSVTNGTVISQQCLAALLVIGGVVQNPGPLKEGDAEKENILASLVINTDDDAIKSVLRIYEVGMTTKDLKKKLSVPEKEKLVKTMDFLGVPDQESYTKPAVVHNLICRIQNLFPDKCAICNTLYATQLGETPLLECASCGQGAHTDCITKCLGITTEELPTFTTEKAKEMMNPHNIPGVHYFCGECTENIVPSRDSGRLKRARAHTTTIDEPTEEVFAPEDVQQKKNPLCQDLQNKGSNSQ